MTSKEFFVVAPSDTEYEGNKTASFTIPFHPPINLNRDYYVALREISVPNSFNSFQPLKHRSFFFSVRNLADDSFKLKSVISIPEIFYENIWHVIENINNAISTQMQTLQDDTGVTEDEFLKLEYYPIYKKIKITAPLSKSGHEQKIRFLPYLSQLLGLNDGMLYPETDHSFSSDTVFFNNEISLFYVLLPNLIEPEFVGGRQVGLLRQVIISNTHNDFAHFTYDNPLYKKVIPLSIPAIHFQIVDENFELVKFKKGTAYVVLHFTTRNPK